MSVYQKARIFDPDSPADVFYVQFNPNTLEYSASISQETQKNVQDRSGSGSIQTPNTQQSPLAAEQGSTLVVRLFFHSYLNDLMFHDVRPDVNRVRAFLPAASGSSTGSPPVRASSPRITFAWGTMIYTGTLESFQATYQMFAFDGTPVQAEAVATIRGEDQEIAAASGNQEADPASEADSSPQDDPPLPSDLSWLFQ